jgi:hypothetical protein
MRCVVGGSPPAAQSEFVSKNSEIITQSLWPRQRLSSLQGQLDHSTFSGWRSSAFAAASADQRSEAAAQLQVLRLPHRRCGAKLQARKTDMSFDYGAEAELFPGGARASRRQPVGYRRFASAAEALRFAFEELRPESLAGAALEVGDERFDSRGMRRLYEASDFPLARRAQKTATSATAPPRASPGSSAAAGSGTAKKLPRQQRD